MHDELKHCNSRNIRAACICVPLEGCRGRTRRGLSQVSISVTDIGGRSIPLSIGRTLFWSFTILLSSHQCLPRTNRLDILDVVGAPLTANRKRSFECYRWEWPCTFRIWKWHATGAQPFGRRINFVHFISPFRSVYLISNWGLRLKVFTARVESRHTRVRFEKILPLRQWVLFRQLSRDRK